MANITKRNHYATRDPLALARDLFSWDPFVRMDWPQRSSGQSGFMPQFNVVEKTDAYLLTADVPGVKDENLDVTVHDNQLLITGSRSTEERSEGDSYYLQERSFGSFSRSFALPDNADPDSVHARLDGGVLEVRIAKRESAKPRRIPLDKA